MNKTRPKLVERELRGVLYSVVNVNRERNVQDSTTSKMQHFLENNELSKGELAFIGFFRNYVEPFHNYIVVNKKILTLQQLGEMLGTGRNTMSKIVSGLVSKELLYKIDRHKNPPEIYFNPFLVNNTNYVTFDTYLLFEDSYYNIFKKVDSKLVEKIKDEVNNTYKINRDYGERNTPEYKRWRDKVFKRDNYRCVVCGSNKKIHAHHIDAYQWAIDKRVDVENGSTLCKVHHDLLHKVYGRGENTREEYEEFLKVVEKVC